ncbi:MAG: ferrous iron transport protein A [Candidatus Aminicenantes bacterium]|nr:ferrous iron transport protein A [Candidatus Aminicenantes bacterium]
MISLALAPRGRKLKIAAIEGGEGIRRRLFALGFHKNDLIEVNAQGILRGPFLVRNVTADTIIALGRGIVSRIMVEIVPDEE